MHTAQHTYSDPLLKSNQIFWVTLVLRSALVKGPLWYHWKVARTTMASFIGKNVKLFWAEFSFFYYINEDKESMRFQRSYWYAYHNCFPNFLYPSSNKILRCAVLYKWRRRTGLGRQARAIGNIHKNPDYFLFLWRQIGMSNDSRRKYVHSSRAYIRCTHM